MALETVTLTDEQIARQNLVDNAIMDLIIRLAPKEEQGSIDWNIDEIGMVRDELKFILCDELYLMDEEDFYPSLPDEDKDNGYIDTVKMTVTEEELAEALRGAVDSLDLYDLGAVAGEVIGGECWYNCADGDYVFVPNENYTGAFGEEIEKREGLRNEPEDYNVGE